MGKIEDNAKRIAGIGAGLAGAVSALLKVEGRPVVDKDRPASVTIAGLPFFNRDADGMESILWIPRFRKNKRTRAAQRQLSTNELLDKSTKRFQEK